MITLLSLIGFAYLMTMLVTPLCERYAPKRLFDFPDQIRKQHPQPVPRVGGIAIGFGFCATIALVSCVGSFDPKFGEGMRWQLIVAAALVFAVGLLDDIFGLGPVTKLSAETLAGILVTHSGVIAYGSDLSYGFAWSDVFTVVWLVSVMNAVNLIDGVDGLACGVMIPGLLALVIMNAPGGSFLAILLSAPLLGCLLGLGVYNRHPARVFLGDAGSLSVGLLIGIASLAWRSSASAAFPAMASLVAVPTGDVLWSLLRRAWNKRPIFQADRGHIHHRLLQAGLSPEEVTLLLTASSFAFAVCSFFSAQLSLSLSFAALVVTGGAVIATVMTAVSTRSQIRAKRQMQLDLITTRLRPVDATADLTALAGVLGHSVSPLSAPVQESKPC